MAFLEPINFEPNNLNSAARAFYEFTQAYNDTSAFGMSILEDPNRPWLLDQVAKSDAVCPVGHTCVPTGDTRGFFVRDVSDNKIYFSEVGWQRYHDGAHIDWAGVARDLITIVSGSAGGVGEVLSAVSQMLGVAGWGISLFHDNPPPR